MTEKDRESQEDFIARRNGALVSLDDLVDEVFEHVNRSSKLYFKAFDFICAKELLEEYLSELGFEFGKTKS